MPHGPARNASALGAAAVGDSDMSDGPNEPGGGGDAAGSALGADAASGDAAGRSSSSGDAGGACAVASHSAGPASNVAKVSTARSGSRPLHAAHKGIAS